jgi:hypothetical protein
MVMVLLSRIFLSVASSCWACAKDIATKNINAAAMRDMGGAPYRFWGAVRIVSSPVGGN